MSQYIPERRFNHWDQYYDSPLYNNTWHTAPPPPPQVDYNAFPASTDYPESSQRTILTSSPDEAGVLHPIYDHRRSHSSHSSDYNHSTMWDANVDKFQYPDLEMHVEDTGEPMVEAHPESSRQISPPSVKVEPDDPDGCFIMELSSMSPSLALSVSGLNQTLAPPTEVPLRATQASKEMRKMMGVFRLNPFAMHSGEGRGVMPALWCGGGPLEEEPLIFEFQLDIEDDSGDRQIDLVGVPSSGAPGSPTTDLLGAEEEAQLRSFSPSFELHPEDDMREEHEQEQEDYTDPDQQNEWSDADCGNQSEVDTSSTTQSVHTPSETRSAHTPFNDSSSVYQYPINPSVASSWDIDSYQAHGEEHLPPVEKMEGHKMHRVHTGMYFYISSIKSNQRYLFFFFLLASHPYLRRSIVNPHQASPSSSTNSLPQSHPHLHTTTQPQLNFGYPILQHPTTHHHYNNQVPSHNHSQSYPQHQHPTTVHDSMISAPLELMPPHGPENSMYSSSYMRSGRTMKLAAEEETSSALHHHHHPAGIVNEYHPRGTVSDVYASQHDTHNHGHHQYEVRFFFYTLHLLSTRLTNFLRF